ncbi:MAG: hypothetical protein OXG60_15175 [Chloroflexi bacterium]|nr:hypothetical protein [Chloroflexota bacterium]
MTGDTPTSWIWADEASGGVKGARIDLAASVIEWVDQPGCACGDAIARQPIADFSEKGPLETPPADVLDEMRDAVNKALSIDSPPRRR